MVFDSNVLQRSPKDLPNIFYMAQVASLISLSIICLISLAGAALKRTETAFVDFLCSYGQQLVKADLPGWLEEESLARITEECPNMRMKIHAFDYRFSLLNNRMQTLCMEDPLERDNENNEPWGSLSETMWKYTTVVNLCVVGKGERPVFLREFIRALLPMRMDSLHYLNLKGYSNLNPSYDPLNYIATVTSHLEKLHISSSTISPATINAICSANRALRIIYVDTRSPGGDAQLNVGSGLTPELIVYIHAFLICKQLRKLELVLRSAMPPKEELRNFCVRFRKNSALVKFFIQFPNGRFTNEDV